ncbi:MAG: MFS transporter [Chloroflexota bacterium]
MAGSNNRSLGLAASFRATFPALCSRNYVYFITGQSVSQIGTWMQTAGQNWLVYVTTQSPLKLGLVSAAQFLPVMFLSLFAGVFVDRFPKRAIVVWTQVAAALQAFALAALVFTNQVQYWHVLLLALCSGLVRTVDNPARQSLMIELVGKEALVNAIGLNSTVFNVARIVGPAVAGIAYEKYGPGWCFLLNGLSFLPVIAGLLAMDIKARKRATVKKNVLREVVEGLNYIGTKPLLISTVALAAVVNIFAVNHSVLLTILARDDFRMGAGGYGYMMSFMGAGSLVGALFTAVSGAKRGPRSGLLGSSSMIIASLLAGLGAFGLFRSLPLAMIILALTGVFNLTFSTNANSTMQLNAADGYRGRVMSVYFLVWGGTTPIGSLFAGALASRFGASWAYIVSGLVTAASACAVLAVQRRLARRLAHAATPAAGTASDA